MSKQHDENQDVRVLSRKMYVNSGTKTIKASKSDIIGIKTWARIDYLCHFKGYHLIWDNALIDRNSYEDSEKKKELRNTKKAARQHTLADKTKRTSNRKQNG